VSLPYQRLLGDGPDLEARLVKGAQRARRRSEPTLARTMVAMGL
jgi:hypothetical protein